MTIMGKVLRIAVAVLGIGIAAAVVLDRRPWERVATIPAGTTLVAALEEDVSREDSRVGDEIELFTVGSIRLGNGAEVPEGSQLTGEVMHTYGGESAVPPEVRMRFTELKIAGNEYKISTHQYRYGIQVVPAKTSDQVIFSAGQQLTIRLSRPVVVRSRAGSEQLVTPRR